MGHLEARQDPTRRQAGHPQPPQAAASYLLPSTPSCPHTKSCLLHSPRPGGSLPLHSVEDRLCPGPEPPGPQSSPCPILPALRTTVEASAGSICSSAETLCSCVLGPCAHRPHCPGCSEKSRLPASLHPTQQQIAIPWPHPHSV